jgi:hypothetical protein
MYSPGLQDSRSAISFSARLLFTRPASGWAMRRIAAQAQTKFSAPKPKPCCRTSGSHKLWVVGIELQASDKLHVCLCAYRIGSALLQRPSAAESSSLTRPASRILSTVSSTADSAFPSLRSGPGSHTDSTVSSLSTAGRRTRPSLHMLTTPKTGTSWVGLRLQVSNWPYDMHDLLLRICP